MANGPACGPSIHSDRIMDNDLALHGGAVRDKDDLTNAMLDAVMAGVDLIAATPFRTSPIG